MKHRYRPDHRQAGNRTGRFLWLFCLVVVTFAARAAQHPPLQPADSAASAPDSAKKDTPSAAAANTTVITITTTEDGIAHPVVLDADTLFYLTRGISVYKPGERAQAISSRVKKLARDVVFYPDSLIMLISESDVSLMYGELRVLSVFLSDVEGLSITPQEQALQYRQHILDGIQKYRDANSLRIRIIGGILVIVVISILAALLWAVGRLFRRLSNWVLARKDTLFRGVHIRHYELFNSDQHTLFMVKVLRFLKWVVILVLIYLSLPILFSIFPLSEGWARILFRLFLNPLSTIARAVVEYLPNLVMIVVIVTVFHYVFNALRFFRNEIAKGDLVIPGFYADWARPTYYIFRFLIMAFMVVVIFPYLPGSDSAVFRGVTVFIGFLFTFGSMNSLSSIMAGIVITYMRSYSIGDRVRIADLTGDVIEKTMLVTRIRTTKNEIISIPNATILTSHIINYSSDAPDKGLILHTTVTIGYDAPWRQVHELLIGAALATEFIEKEPKPFVLQTSLDDFYVSYQINAYTRAPNRQAATYSLLHQNIQDKFNEAGVEIMSPHYRAQRDGSHTTVPADYLPAGYQAPPFRVQPVPEQDKKKPGR
jgi:small-conductance mechanosensitive channel